MDNQPSLFSLDQEKLIELLVKGGYRAMSADELANDIDAGMPLNADGTVNLIHYIAWLVKEVNTNANESGQA